MYIVDQVTARKKTLSQHIIGIDEVGRGCLAGPVTVAAVLMPHEMKLNRKNLPRLRDSKKLLPGQREKWNKFLKQNKKIKFAVTHVPVSVIDEINITKAANFAATKSFEKVIKKCGGANFKIFLDGGLYIDKRYKDYLPQTVIKGDEKIPAIALASIAAKVARDRLMRRLHKQYPAYGLETHKGYATRQHREALLAFGSCELHRRTFLKKMPEWKIKGAAW